MIHLRRFAAALPILLLAGCGGGESGPSIYDSPGGPFQPVDDSPTARDTDTSTDCTDVLTAAVNRQSGEFPDDITEASSPSYSTQTWTWPGYEISIAWGPAIDGCTYSDRTA